MERQRRSIHLFDLDDTLIQTSARVLVKQANGEIAASLSPAEFSVYQLKPGESFDFHEFSDIGILSRGVVVKYTRSIIETILGYGTRSQFGILTARGDKNLHAPFLIRLFKSLFGIRLAKEHIFAVSDRRFAEYKDKLPHGAFLSLSGDAQGQSVEVLARFSSLSVAQRKALVIAEDLVGRGFNDISFYDDSRDNLESFKVMRQAFPHVVYKPHFIDPTWKIRLGEFWESGSASKSLIKGLSSVRIILEHHSLHGRDYASALAELEEGNPISLETFPLWLACESGKFYLRRFPERVAS